MAKVLLVEDDDSLREILAMRLQAEAYETLSARDGQEGLRLAVSEKPDLIIADIMMPGFSGFDMLKNLRATPEVKDIKVIIFTALGTPEDRAVGESLGVSRYLVKSQDNITPDLLKAVEEVLAPDQNPVIQPSAAPATTETTSAPVDTPPTTRPGGEV